MNLPCLHLRNSINDLFGLRESRFLYNQEHYVPKSEVQKAADASAEAIKADVEKLEAGIQSSINQYNNRFALKRPKDDSDMPLEINLSDLDGAMAYIEARLNTLRQLLDPTNPSRKLERQIKQLEKIHESLDLLKLNREDAREIVDKDHGINEKRASQRRQREIYERIGEGKEQMANWEKKDLYHDVVDYFDEVSSDPEFDNLFKTPNGVEGEKGEQMRHLYIAIMAQETSDFENGNLFGSDFTDDYQSNIDRFPFFYNEYLKKASGIGLSLERIAEVQSGVEMLDQRVAGIRDVSSIVQLAGPSSGLSQDSLAQLIVEPKDEAQLERAELLVHFIENLNNKKHEAEENNDPAQAKSYATFAEELDVHRQLALAKAKHFELLKRKEELDKNFTASYFFDPQNPINQKLAIHLSLMQFSASVQHIEHPLIGSGSQESASPEMGHWQYNYHPTVYRDLVYMQYNAGVGHYEKDENGRVTYNKNQSYQKADMMAAITKADYFNAKEIGDHLDYEHRVGLLIMNVGFEVDNFLQNTKMASEVIDLYIQAKEATLDASKVAAEQEVADAKKALADAKVALDDAVTSGDEDRIKAAKDERNLALKALEEATSRLNSLPDPQIIIDKALDQLATMPQSYVAAYGKLTLDDLKAAKTQYQEDVNTCTAWLYGAREFLENPYSEDSKIFLKAVMEGGMQQKLQGAIEGLTGRLGIDGPQIDQMEQSLKRLEIDFNAQDLSERNDLEFFDAFGISLERSWPRYLEYIAQHPEAAVEYWIPLMQSKNSADRKTVRDCIAYILPDSMGQGKQDLLNSIDVLFDEPDLSAYIASPEMSTDNAITFGLVMGIKEHLRLRSSVQGYSDRRQKEIEAQIDGMHPGDKVAKYGGDVWDYLKSLSIWGKVAAGFVGLKIIYPEIKALLSKSIVRKGVIAGIGDYVLYKSTGHSMLEKIRGDSGTIEAAEGTYGGYLMRHGEEVMRGDHLEDKDKITEREQAAVLSEMENVPLAELIEFVRSTDENGMPLPGQVDKFPTKINKGRIAGARSTTWEEQDMNLFVHRAVKMQMIDFSTYVGNKDNNRGYEHGMLALNERWHLMRLDRKYKPKYTEFWWHDFLDDRGRESVPTFGEVVREEIDPNDVERTKGSSNLGQFEAKVGEMWEGSTDWLRDHVSNPGSGMAEIFFTRLGDTAHQTADVMGDVANRLGTKWHFTKESAKLMYNSKEFEFFIDGVKKNGMLAWDTGTTTIKTIFGLEVMTADFLHTKVKQLDAIASTRHQSTIENRDLQVTDIVPNPATEGFSNVDANPAYAYYQEFQTECKEAFLAADHFYLNPDDGVGYFMAEVDLATAGINMQDETYRSNPQNVDRALEAATRKQALKEFEKRGMGMAPAEIEKYMWDVHTVDKTHPPKKYVFYRLPMTGSAELLARQSGEWTDYDDPKKFGDRINGPFRVDPSKTGFENFMHAMRLDIDPVRGVIAGATSIASQLPKLAIGTGERVGSAYRWLVNGINKARGAKGRQNPLNPNALDVIFVRPDSQKQDLDIAFHSSNYPRRAISDFFSIPFNAELAEISDDYSRKTGESYYTGLFQVDPAFQGTLFNTSSHRDTLVRMREYYIEDWSLQKGHTQNPAVIARFDQAIAAGY